eukprot:CAMPEP_0180825296 /NCGR_PEP_ID=MMETSP1038_2-20121128/72892_1 /TAXON_ID=632150 /ORGANISM="Azadinium spinosum, Strain 3D9" /LENGTH=148 /DNA_ID=CAMNT_0022867743 /DNA_START=17 /DNA_END=460 /DNA_ORIENTATION=+
MTGEEVTLSMPSSSSISDLKLELEQHWSIPAFLQKVIAGEHVIKDSEPVKTQRYYLVLATDVLEEVFNDFRRDCFGLCELDDLFEKLKPLDSLGPRLSSSVTEDVKDAAALTILTALENWHADQALLADNASKAVWAAKMFTQLVPGP